MSDLNSDTFGSNDSLVVKDSQWPTFRYLTFAGFQNSVKTAMQSQQILLSKNINPLTIDPFDAIETLVFLDFVSVSNTLTINLPAGLFEGQRVNVSINVLSGTPLTTIVVKDDTGVTLYTFASQLTVGFIVDQDLVWKRL